MFVRNVINVVCYVNINLGSEPCMGPGVPCAHLLFGYFPIKTLFMCPLYFYTQTTNRGNRPWTLTREIEQ